ncbi:MAG: hypothetical protein SFV18_12230 [Bryobacteraceae bacterium]|nr:hypothetical protein [Bryobacteraceae bacterium]
MESWDERGEPASALAATVNLSVRADGSTSKETYWDRSPGKGSIQEIVDTAALKVLTVDHSIRAYTTSPISRASAARRRANPPSCEQMYGNCSPGESILGYETQIAEIAPGGPGGVMPSAVMKVWVAPALGWARLKEEHYRAGSLVSRQTVTNVREGPPNPALFHVPAEYRLLDPADLMAETANDRGEKISPQMLEQTRQRMKARGEKIERERKP